MITNLQEKKGGIRHLDVHAARFAEVIHQIKCIDIKTSNGIFTWNKKRIGSNGVASKLDRFLLSESIVLTGGSYEAQILPSVGSDHWPISLTWEGKHQQLTKPFRIEHCWFKDPNFKFKV